MAYKTFLLTVLLAALMPLSGRAEMRDPTKPAQLAQKEAPVINHDDGLTLSAIWISAISRRAIINGVTAKQGQTILNGIQVIQIWHNSVTVKQNGISKTLRLIKRPYKNQLNSRQHLK